MKLINVKTGQEVQKGEILTDFRGERVKLVDFTKPQHSSSSGRIYVIDDYGIKKESFPIVCNLKFVEKQDETHRY